MRHTGHLIKAALGETIIDRSHGFPGPRKQKYLAAGHDHQGIIAMVCPKLAMKLPSDTVRRRGEYLEQLHEIGINLTHNMYNPLNRQALRSEAHTSELQSLMRISYAVFCLKQTTQETTPNK